jgi:hypothetical protein
MVDALVLMSLGYVTVHRHSKDTSFIRVVHPKAG